MGFNGTENGSFGKSLQWLISQRDRPGIEAFLEQASPAEVAREVSSVDRAGKASLFEMLGPEKSAEILTKVFNIEKGHILEQLPVNQSSPIVQEMGTEAQVRLIRNLDEEKAETTYESHSDRLNLIQRTPWWVISIIFHAAFLLISHKIYPYISQHHA